MLFTSMQETCTHGLKKKHLSSICKWRLKLHFAVLNKLNYFTEYDFCAMSVVKYQFLKLSLHNIDLIWMTSVWCDITLTECLCSEIL